MGAPDRLVLGLDISTTATKAVLVSPDGSVVGVAASTYGYDAPAPRWIEQDPRVWWLATQEAIRAVLATTGTPGSSVEAVGICGQMHGLVLLDAVGDVVRPAILWNDQRTQAECDEIRGIVGPGRLLAITGNDALPGFTAPKLMWVRKHDPRAWMRTRHVLLPKDYIRWRLTGERAIEVSDGAGTLLLDLRTRTWSDEIIEVLDVDPSMLPRTVEGPDLVGTVSAEAASATGLRAGTPVVGGAGDQAANAIGVGAVAPGVTALSLGTSGVVFTPTRGPVFDHGGQVHALCHAVPDTWHVMGVSLAAGGSLKWLRDRLAPSLSWDELTSLAAHAPPGSEGLVWLPYLTGDQTVHVDPLARAAFVGLTVRHELGHLVRAVLEGVGFSLREIFELVQGMTPDPLRDVRASGGGTRSTLWNRIMADVLGMPISVSANAEAAATGAAILASVAAGWHPTVEASCAALVGPSSIVEPGPDVAAYVSVTDIYRGLYPALQGSFVRLAEVSPHGGPSD